MRLNSLFVKAKNIIKNEKSYIRGYLNNRDRPLLKKVIILESLHGKSIDGHIFYLTKYLAKNSDWKIKIVARNTEKARLKISKYMNFSNIEIVEHGSYQYGKYLARAEILVNDNTFYPFFSKRPNQKYYNTWHGTPLKTLGRHMENKVNFGNVQRNFFMADSIILSNDYTKDIFIDAFNLKKLFPGEIVLGPSVRNSVLYNKERGIHIKKEQNWNNKKLVMYMPTWRGSDGNVDNLTTKRNKDLIELSEKIDDNTLIVYKNHTMENGTLPKNLKNVVYFPEEYELYDFLTAVDVLVTDYSSIMYDFAGTNKKILLYVYDKDDYFVNRGVYEDIDSYPFYQVYTIDELVAQITNEKKLDYSDFTGKFCDRDQLLGEKIIGDYILKDYKLGIDIIKINNRKKNIAIFSGGLWDNGITTALINMLNKIDLNEANYFLIFGQGKMRKEFFYKLDSLPEEVTYYPIPGISINTFFERYIHKKYLKSDKKNIFGEYILKKIYKREVKRIFGEVHVDHFIHYTGFDRKYAELATYGGIESSMFVHTDMFEDYKNKKNYNLRVIRSAYEKVKNIILVNEFLKSGFEENIPQLVKKLKVVNNFIDEQRIVNLSEESLIDTIVNVKFHQVNSKKYIYDEISYSIESLRKFGYVDTEQAYITNSNMEKIQLAQFKASVKLMDRYSFLTKNEAFQKVERLYLAGEVRKILLEQLISNEIPCSFTEELNGNFFESEIKEKIYKYYIDQESSKAFDEKFPYVIDKKNEIISSLKRRDSIVEVNHTMNDYQFFISHLGISKSRLLNDLYNDKVTVFLNIGRFDKQKGHDRLIGAFEKFNLKNPNSRLIIVAPYGPERKNTIELVKKSIASENIYLLSRMDNPYPLIKIVDAFILSSYYEGLGLVVYEALALNKQVITVNLETTLSPLPSNCVITCENSEKGIFDGMLMYEKGKRANAKFDFISYNNRSIQEFSSTILNYS